MNQNLLVEGESRGTSSSTSSAFLGKQCMNFQWGFAPPSWQSFSVTWYPWKSRSRCAFSASCPIEILRNNFTYIVFKQKKSRTHQVSVTTRSAPATASCGSVPHHIPVLHSSASTRSQTAFGARYFSGLATRNRCPRRG